MAMSTPTEVRDMVTVSRQHFDYLMGLARIAAEAGPKIRITHLAAIQAEADAS